MVESLAAPRIFHSHPSFGIPTWVLVGMLPICLRLSGTISPSGWVRIGDRGRFREKKVECTLKPGLLKSLPHRGEKKLVTPVLLSPVGKVSDTFDPGVYPSSAAGLQSWPESQMFYDQS